MVSVVVVKLVVFNFAEVTVVEVLTEGSVLIGVEVDVLEEVVVEVLLVDAVFCVEVFELMSAALPIVVVS